MINGFMEALNNKTIDQYKIIERENVILKRYIMLFFENHTLMTKEDAELILRAIETEPRMDAELMLKALQEEEENNE